MKPTRLRYNHSFYDHSLNRWYRRLLTVSTLILLTGPARAGELQTFRSAQAVGSGYRCVDGPPSHLIGPVTYPIFLAGKAGPKLTEADRKDLRGMKAFIPARSIWFTQVDSPPHVIIYASKYGPCLVQYSVLNGEKTAIYFPFYDPEKTDPPPPDFAEPPRPWIRSERSAVTQKWDAYWKTEYR